MKRKLYWLLVAAILCLTCEKESSGNYESSIVGWWIEGDVLCTREWLQWTRVPQSMDYALGQETLIAIATRRKENILQKSSN